MPDEPGWLGVGYPYRRRGGVLILVSLVLAIGLRRVRPDATSSTPGRVVGAVSVLVLAIYLNAVGNDREVLD